VVGFVVVFLGFRIQRWRRGDGRRVVLTIPSKQALAGVMRKIKQATRAATTCCPSLILPSMASSGLPTVWV
jgi:hypothetical protein